MMNIERLSNLWQTIGKHINNLKRRIWNAIWKLEAHAEDRRHLSFLFSIYDTHTQSIYLTCSVSLSLYHAKRNKKNIALIAYENNTKIKIREEKKK